MLRSIREPVSYTHLKAEAEEQMEETTPYLSDARTSEEMYKAMISKGRLDNRPEIKWNPIQDRL